jgi:hypothetical protein
MSGKKKDPAKTEAAESETAETEDSGAAEAKAAEAKAAEATAAEANAAEAKAAAAKASKQWVLLPAVWDSIRSHIATSIAVGVGAVFVGLFFLLGDAVRPKIKNYILSVLISDLPKDKDGEVIFENALENYILSTVVEKKTTSDNSSKAMTEYILRLLSSEDLSKLEGYEKLRGSIRLLIKDELTRLQNIQDSYSRVDTIMQRGFLYDRDTTSVENPMNFPMFEIFAYKGQEVLFTLNLLIPVPTPSTLRPRGGRKARRRLWCSAALT